MKLTYIGPHAAVDVRLPSDRWVTAQRHGDPIDVEDEHGASLLEQADNWAAAETPKASTKQTKSVATERDDGA